MNFGTSAQFTGGELAIQYDENPDIYGDNGSLPGEQATESFPVPVMFRLGLSVPFKTSEDSRFLVAGRDPASERQQRKREFGVRMGIDQDVRPPRRIPDPVSNGCPAGLTLGFGVKGDLGNNNFQVDYAWAGHKYLQDTHRISMAIHF